ncbi:MAG: hypothetical protein KJO98_12820 [Rhodothermia bacterium]|nr:hypothetical protein [Rhodothermia bacterium]
MKTSNRLVRELIVFVSVTAIAIVVLPVVAAALAYQSRQAMFWPAYQSLYTYFLPYTIVASATVGFAVAVIRALVRWVKGIRR